MTAPPLVPAFPQASSVFLLISPPLYPLRELGERSQVTRHPLCHWGGPGQFSFAFPTDPSFSRGWGGLPQSLHPSPFLGLPRRQHLHDPNFSHMVRESQLIPRLAFCSFFILKLLLLFCKDSPVCLRTLSTEVKCPEHEGEV